MQRRVAVYRASYVNVSACSNKKGRDLNVILAKVGVVGKGRKANLGVERVQHISASLRLQNFSN
jgi:hypothetical protein